MRLRDLLVLSAAVGFALFSVEWSYGPSLVLSWSFPFPTSPYANGHTPAARETLPPPIVTDLEGDGRSEVVFFTPDLTLHVLSWSDRSSLLAHRSQASLLPKTHRAATGRRPVAMAAGYLDPFDPEAPSARQQVLVVLTEAWSVLCFDASLRLLWEAAVERSDDDRTAQSAFWFHREAVVLVSSVPIFHGDRGSVVVGGRLVSDESSGDLIRGRTGLHVHSMGSRSSSSSNHAGNAGNAGLGMDSAVASADTHNAFYALDGGTGRERWRHEAHDYSPEDDHAAEPAKQVFNAEHSYVLHVLAQQQGRHLGEVDWTLFKDSVLAQLPHRWAGPSDSRVSLAHFAKDYKSGRGKSSSSSSKSNSKSNSKTNSNSKSKRNDDASSRHKEDNVPLSAWGAASSHFHTPGVLHGGWAPHAEEEHVERPNVVVVHGQKGVEVLHLYTGRTLCSLNLLQPPLSVFADINGDGIVDRVYASSASHGHHGDGSSNNNNNNNKKGHQSGQQQLQFFAESVYQELHLWNVSLSAMRGASALGRLSWRAGALKKSLAEDADAMPAAPITFPSGWRLTPTQRQQRKAVLQDVLFLLADGRVINIRPEDGRLNWMTQTKATKISAAHSHKSDDHGERRSSDGGVGEGAGEFGRKLFSIPDLSMLGSAFFQQDAPTHSAHSSLHAFPMRLNGPVDSILAVGNSLVILSAKGQILAETDIHSGVPLLNPTIADWNNDGVMDFIIFTADAYYGFSYVITQNSLLIPILLAVLFVLFATIGILRSSQVGPRLQKTTLKRGTD